MINFKVNLFNINYIGTVELDAKGKKDFNTIRLNGKKPNKLQSAGMIEAIVTDSIEYL